MDANSQSPSRPLDGDERLAAEESIQLLDDVERYSFALEAAGVAVWEWDVSRDRIRWSNSAGGLHGMQTETLPTSFFSYRDLVHSEDRVGLIAATQRFLADGGEETLVYRIIRPDGSVRWIEARGRRLPVRDSHTLIVVGLSQDVTRRKEADEINRRMAAIVEASHDAIYSKRLDGTLTSWNGGAVWMFGYSSEEMIGQNSRIIVPPERIDEEYGMLGRAAAGRPIQEFATIRKHKNGNLVDVLISVSPLTNEDGHVTGVSCIARDVTRRKKLEEQLIQSQKMEALGHLAGGIAHDFNNILTVIIGSCELLQVELGQEGAGLSTVAEIRRSGERAASLTRQLLAFSRRQMLQPVIVNLNDVVQEAEMMLRRLIGEDYALEMQLEPGLRRIRADRAQLHQVIMNLMVNARDALPRGGRIKISTANVSQVLPLQSASPGDGSDAFVDGVNLIVEDNGCGMTAEIRERIFEPFFTTKDVGHGTGLGLSTVQGIVAQTGGRIHVESEVGRGTKFRIFLPAVAETPELSQVPREQSSDHLRGKESILIVEDEASLRNLAKLVLEGNGYAVTTAENGEDALEKFAARSTSVNLLITDLVMPRLSGWELVRRLSLSDPRMKVLYISGYNPEMITRLIAEGRGISFLQKPFTTAALVKKVREVLDTVVSSLG